MNVTAESAAAIADELRAASEAFHAISRRAIEAMGTFDDWAKIINSPEYAAADDRYRAALARAGVLLRYAQRQGGH